MAPRPANNIADLLKRALEDRLRTYSLTPRELEIVWLLLQGRSNKEIAARCFICEQTVNDHLKHAYQKLGIHSRTALIPRLLEMPAHVAPTAS